MVGVARTSYLSASPPDLKHAIPNVLFQTKEEKCQPRRLIGMLQPVLPCRRVCVQLHKPFFFRPL